MTKPSFEIGYKFKRRGKNRQVETIEDILTTTNSAGKVVKIEYRCSHHYLGQLVFDRHIETTVLMAETVK